MNITKFRFNLFLGTVVAISSAIPPALNAQDVVAARTTVITACGKLFAIDANADHLTPEQRASIVQKNLDNALVAAKDRSPEAVRVSMLNNNPILTLDHFYIVTADGNSAKRNHMTQMELAHKWADSIRMCLADSQAVKNYISMLTGKYPKTAIKEGFGATTVSVLPFGALLPIELTQPLDTGNLMLNQPIEAALTTDVPLQPLFNSYIPAGTVALGHLVNPGRYNVNHIAGKEGLMVSFFALRTPDGKEIPIDGHVLGGFRQVDERMLGGVNRTHYISVQPIQPNCLVTKTSAVITDNTIAFGPAVTTSTTCCGAAQKGTIVGAWRGLRQDALTQDETQYFNALILTRKPGHIIPAGEPLMLQLSSSSSIAVASPLPAAGAEVASVGVGM
jgi:hypothetical protein